MAVGPSSTGITSPGKIVANILISFIGSGMLGLPYAYKESGVMEGALIMSLVGYLSVSAMLMLIDCKYAILTSGGRSGGRSITMETKAPLIAPDSSTEDDFDIDEKHQKNKFTDLTYGDIGLYALGPGGKKLVDVAIVISQIGFCCGYLIYICESLSTYIHGISQNQWLTVLMPPLYCLTLVRHLNKLAIFSLFAQVSNILALAVVFWFDFSNTDEKPFSPKEFNVKGLPFFFAISIYCYEGAGMILSLEESVHERLRHRFKSLFTCTMMFLTVLYIAFGISGYLSFGPHTKQIITFNLPHGKSAVDFAAMVKICLGVALFFTYPMMMFPVTHLLDKALGFQVNYLKGNILRLILVITTGLVVLAIPDFSILTGLIGATCCTLLAFILPALFHLYIFKQRMSTRQRYFDILLIVLGVFGAIIGLWGTLNKTNGPLEVNEFSHPTQKIQNISTSTFMVNNTSPSETITMKMSNDKGKTTPGKPKVETGQNVLQANFKQPEVIPIDSSSMSESVSLNSSDIGEVHVEKNNQNNESSNRDNNNHNPNKAGLEVKLDNKNHNEKNLTTVPNLMNNKKGTEKNINTPTSSINIKENEVVTTVDKKLNNNSTSLKNNAKNET